jgi:mRNA interferase RelE/StbE
MPAAPQVYYPAFDRAFFSLPSDVQARIQDRIDGLGLNLPTFAHYRMTASEDYRLRIGDYRVIYDFDPASNILYLWNLGHRRSVYRSR